MKLLLVLLTDYLHNDLIFDMQNIELKAMSLLQKNRPDIPEVTKEEKQRAIDIALAEPVVQQILKDKGYQIAPNGSIGVWHTEDLIKLGVSFEITFDKFYMIESKLPIYQKDSIDFYGEADGITICVLLNENRVATIFAKSPIVEN